MIGRIRRMLARSSGDAKEEEDWSLETELDEGPEPKEDDSPKTEADFEPVPEITEEGSDYYTNLIKASIAAGGKFGEREIPIQWLRMILAGLEGRDGGIEVLLMERRAETLDLPESINMPGQAPPLLASGPESSADWEPGSRGSLD